MKSKTIEHLLSILFVGAVMFALLCIFSRAARPKPFITGLPAALTTNRALPDDFSFYEPNTQFARTLLEETLNCYYPGEANQNKALATAITIKKQSDTRNALERSTQSAAFSWNSMIRLIPMYGKFLLVYCIVFMLTWYGLHTIAVWRFCRLKAKKTSRVAITLIKNSSIGILSFVLFCPAYVIAYSMRTELNTDTTIFLILLCTISNGLLMVYANKFYSFLIGESRKGYVDTATVKNLNTLYDHSMQGISWRAIVSIQKKFPGHAFDQIYRNAAVQFLSTIKELSSFLITGLIITEMALNIHGHLSYELMRQMLYKNYPQAIAIVFALFITVKATEVLADILIHRTSLRYQNK